MVDTERVRSGATMVHAYADKHGLSDQETEHGKTLRLMLGDLFVWAGEGEFLDALHEAREEVGEKSHGQTGRAGA